MGLCHMVATVNPLPGVPLIDNPFFDRLVSSLPSDVQRIARALHDNGYAVIDFPDDKFEELSSSIRSRYAPRADELDAWRLKGKDLRSLDCWPSDPEVRRIASNAKIMRLLEQLYGKRAVPFQTLVFPVGSQQRAHSDAAHFDSSPQGFMCGVWLALEDIDYDNGPLIYYPGSHRWPHFSNEHLGINAWHLPSRLAHGDDYERLWQDMIDLYGAKPERFTAKKGQAILWHARLLHGGDKQHDQTRTRFSQVTHYFFEGCAYYTPFYSDPFYGNIFFRHPVNIATGEPIENFVSGRKVPSWFIVQAKYHGPIGATKHTLSRWKQSLLGARRGQGA